MQSITYGEVSIKEIVDIIEKGLMKDLILIFR